MSFEAVETSRSLGAPIGALLFTYGDNDGDTFAYTDAEQPVTIDNVVYTPVPTDRDSVTASGSLDKATIDIKLPQDSDIARYFDVWPPSRVVTLVVKEGHVGETDWKVAWAGRVIGHKIEGDAVIFTCEPINTSLRRSGLRRKYQYGCPHVLYGAQCRASQPAATAQFTVSAVDGAIVELPGGWAASDRQQKYLNGVATYTSTDDRVEARSIIKILNDTQILLGGPAQGLVAGVSIALSLGCNHQMGDCADLHDNILNFGGQPWIPYKSPFGVINNFY